VFPEFVFVDICVFNVQPVSLKDRLSRTKEDVSIPMNPHCLIKSRKLAHPSYLLQILNSELVENAQDNLGHAMHKASLGVEYGSQKVKPHSL
jgi:hypothetical protein